MPKQKHIRGIYKEKNRRGRARKIWKNEVKQVTIERNMQCRDIKNFS